MPHKVFAYICARVLGSIGRFFLHWYTNGSRIFWHAALDFFEELERIVSLRITAANWYRPLYQDYTRLGMFLGIPIRIARILLTTALYLLLAVVFALVYALYLAVPIFLVSRLA